MTRTLVSEAIRHCRSSQGRLDASRCLLARSHRLLNRAWWIAGASDVDGDDNHGAKGVIHIECRKHAGEPSEYLVSFGGHKDGVGAFYLGKASGFDSLTSLLRKLGVPSPATSSPDGGTAPQDPERNADVGALLRTWPERLTFESVRCTVIVLSI